MRPIVMTSQTIVAQIYVYLRKEIELLEGGGHKPALAVVLVGNDPNSLTYIAVKQKRAAEIGIGFTLHHLNQSASEETIVSIIEQLNSQGEISGIIVQLPLPNHLNAETILGAVDLTKDVDGLRSSSPFMPPTVLAILQLLQSYEIPLTGKKIVVVGKGRLVGAPLTAQLQRLRLDVTTCDEQTGDLAACTIGADILISATGEQHLIQPSMVKEGAVIIDIDEEVVYDQVLERVSYITPQKGGVGPLTVAFLLANVVSAAGGRPIPEL